MRLFNIAVLLIAIGMALFPPWIHSAWIPVGGADGADDHTASGGGARGDREAKAGEKKQGAKPDAGEGDESGWREIRVASTYHWFWSPPPPPNWKTPKAVYWSVTIDYWRLGFEYALLAAGAAWLMISGRSEAEEG